MRVATGGRVVARPSRRSRSTNSGLRDPRTASKIWLKGAELENGGLRGWNWEADTIHQAHRSAAGCTEHKMRVEGYGRGRLRCVDFCVCAGATAKARRQRARREETGRQEEAITAARAHCDALAPSHATHEAHTTETEMVNAPRSRGPQPRPDIHGCPWACIESAKFSPLGPGK
jgi:hypothetical protein